jgi:hypothetical protein
VIWKSTPTNLPPSWPTGSRRSFLTASTFGLTTECSGTPANRAGSPDQLNNYSPGASGTYVRLNFEAYAEDASHADSAAAVARQALDELQDFVDEASHDPWPGTARPPRPFAEVRGEILHLWYGDRDRTDRLLLACEPIPLASLRP